MKFNAIIDVKTANLVLYINSVQGAALNIICRCVQEIFALFSHVSRMSILEKNALQ